MEEGQPAVRSILSCTFCRQKKLRCDRLRPCGSCTKRGLECAFAHPAPPPRRSTQIRSTKQLNERIRQLEQLVTALGSTPTKPAPLRQEGTVSQDDRSIPDDLGRLQIAGGGMSYVSGAHWTALQHSIAEIRECLEAEQSEAESPAQQPSSTGSALLLDKSPSVSRDEILAHIPPRPTADILVSRFFQSMEPGVLVIHAPTFQREYAAFWSQPETATSTWLSLLFSIMCLAIHLHQRTEDESREDSIISSDACEVFRSQAAYCLIDGKYTTTPSNYTVPALLLYAQTEYFRSPDAQHEIWVIMGITIRLAMRMGLHRDAARYPEISCYEAEMRRRIWALLSQVDGLFSYQIGLPRMIKDSLVDTALPHNLLDSDFDESMTALPPSRPDSDATPVSYLIAKGPIMAVFGMIADHVSSSKPEPYAVTIELDARLTEAHARLPAPFQFRPVDQSITDQPHVIMRRYIIDILYQKSRCILHRNHLGKARPESESTTSRRICLDAAMRLLHHHATIDAQIQPGGVLSQSRWFVTSLTVHDFILAAMILCLELHYMSRDSRLVADREFSTGDLLRALHTSRDIWNAYKGSSREAMQAWRSISVMLEKVGVSTGTVPVTGLSIGEGISAETPGENSEQRKHRSGYALHRISIRRDILRRPRAAGMRPVEYEHGC